MIYLIQQNVTEDGPIKIGVSQNPDQRLRDFQTATPDRLTLRDQFLTADDYKVESILHSTWREYKIRGEWFDLSDLSEYEDVRLFLAVWRATPKKYLASPCSSCGHYPERKRVRTEGLWFDPNFGTGVQMVCRNCGCCGPAAPDISFKSALYDWNNLHVTP